MVITAPYQSSCEIASTLANRFGIIVGRRKWVHQMHNTVREHGYGERLSGFYHVGLGVTDFQTDHGETERRLVAAGRRAVEEDYAEALILGRAGDRPVNCRAETRRVCRDPQARLRLGALAALVQRKPARGGNGGSGAIRQQRSLRQPSCCRGQIRGHDHGE